MAQTLDRRMNDFSPATDADYLYAEDKDGNQVKIDIEDAIKVLGGLPLREKLESPDISWNLKEGKYYHGISLFTGGSYGLLIVLRALDYVVQIDITLANGIFYRTAFYNGDVVVKDWTKIV